uniref:Major facilitator superfamily (MFS) profile domain-containing protein n=1 Tax=Meloidogyne incognita TaxID=6306 RepID=A0A914LWQ4_MELIC
MEEEETKNILTKNQQNYLMWGMGLGNLLAAFPFIFLYSKFGPRYVFFFASIISAIITGLTPLARIYGFWIFLVVRIIQGITFAADFAALGILCTQWAPLNEHGLFLSLASSFSPFSISIANFLSGIFCSSKIFGWQFIYYISSIFCFILAILWLLFYEELPQFSPQVTSKEFNKIQNGKSNAHIEMKTIKQQIPYKAILTNGIVWICWLNAFAELLPGVFIMQYKPQYFNYVLGYSIFDTGWLTALTSLLHIPLKLIFGWASDKISFMSEKQKMILFNNISVGLSGISYIAIVFAPNPNFAFFAFISVSIFYSAACGGFYKCATLTSRQFGHLIMAGIQLNKCLAFFISPALITIFVDQIKNKKEWNYIFVLFFVLSFLANILFCLVATDKPQKFTQIIEN